MTQNRSVVQAALFRRIEEAHPGSASGPGRHMTALIAATRDGVEWTMESCRDDRDEARAAVRSIVDAHAAGMAWRDLLLVAPGKRKWRDRLGVALMDVDLPCRMLLGEPGALPDPEDDIVHVASLYGAEGLTAPYVAIVGLGDLPWKQQPLEEALRIVAAAAAVATRGVRLSRSRSSALADCLFAADPDQVDRPRHVVQRR